MMGLIAFVPYAAVGYCVAALANDVWPTLRSSLSSSAYPASRHGMDGEGPLSTRSCDPATLQRNPSYCFNTATGRVEGSGPLDGLTPPPGTFTVYVDEDGQQTARIYMGDNRMDLLVCHQPGGVYVPPAFDSTPPGGGGGLPPGGGHGSPDDPDCGPRYQPGRVPPQFRYADCEPASLWRNNDSNRLRRKRARWG